MPRCLVKQPNGKFAIWSSVLDKFVKTNLDADQAVAEEIKYETGRGYPGGTIGLLTDMGHELLNINSTGRSWAWAPDWSEALKIIEELHGEDARVNVELENLL